jgi:hypothetical protein
MPKIQQPYLRDYKLTVEKPRAEVPFGTDPAVTEPEFGPMGFDRDPEDAAATYNLGWTLTVPAGSALGRLTAPFTGSLSYEPDEKVVTQWVADPVLLNAMRHQKPRWITIPDRVVFKGVEPSAVESALRQQPNEAWAELRSWGELVDDFFEGTGYLPVRAGALIANPPSADRIYTVLAYDDTTDPDHPLLLNLSWYMEQWPELVNGISAHVLGGQLMTSLWPLWTSEATIRFVKASGVTAAAHGGPPDDYFKTVGKPAASLAEAVQYAKPYDIVLIIDTSVYAEGEIVIDKPLSIVSASKASPLDPAFTPTQFPQIRPKGMAGRVIRVDGGSGSIGPVALVGLTIENGLTMDTMVPEFVGGAGVAVVDMDHVYLDRCCIRNNETTIVGTPTSISLAHITQNLTDFVGHLVAINPIFNILTAFIIATIPSSVVDQQLAGQAFGGGICFGWSDGYVRRSLIIGNTASGRGNGIGIVGYGWPTIENCVIADNQYGPNGRRDGGGIAIEVALPEKLSRSLTTKILVDDFGHWLDDLGVADAIEFAARFVAGVVTGDAFLAQLADAYVGVRKWELWKKADIDRARYAHVNVTKTVFRGNSTIDDGGGLYASVLSRSVVENCTFTMNKTHVGGGGGIRTSMGSDIVIKNCVITSNVGGDYINFQHGIYPGEPGGGGVACRNTGVTISGTPATPTSISKNETQIWAGGGVTLEATSEGYIMFPKDEMWQAILTEVFDFDEMTVKISGNVVIAQNRALHDQTYFDQRPTDDFPNGRQRGPHGWGGGLYIIRGRVDEVADLEIEIADFKNVVRADNAAMAGPLPDPNGGVRSATTNRFRLIDLREKVDDGDDQMNEYLDGTTFEYEGD